MENGHDLFFAVLKRLGQEEVLRDIILIGGWCPLVYREYFNNPAELSMQRTADLDFLVPYPPRTHKEVNVPQILKTLGFDNKISLLDGYEKFVHPDLEIEFLTPERSRGTGKPYAISKLHINAQGLRYLDLLQNNCMKATYRGISINVPEPAAYVLHKFIVSERRKNNFKQEKDIVSALQLGRFLLEQKNQERRIRDVYLSIPDKWKKNLLRVVSKYSDKMYAFLVTLEEAEKE